MYYEITAKYVKLDEKGNDKKVNEQYLVDAVTCSDAEAKTIEKLKEMISGEFNVTKISQSNITEIINGSDGDRWFKAKVNLIFTDEESGKEKKTAQYYLVLANTVNEADVMVRKSMEVTVFEYEVISVSESKILEVWQWLDEEKVPEGFVRIIGIGDDNALRKVKKAIVIETQESINVSCDGGDVWTDHTYGGWHNASELIFEEAVDLTKGPY